MKVLPAQELASARFAGSHCIVYEIPEGDKQHRGRQTSSLLSLRKDHLLQRLNLGIASPVCKDRMPFLVMLDHPSKGILVVQIRSVSVIFLHLQQGHIELAAHSPRLKAAPQRPLTFNNLDEKMTQKLRLTL